MLKEGDVSQFGVDSSVKVVCDMDKWIAIGRFTRCMPLIRYCRFNHTLGAAPTRYLLAAVRKIFKSPVILMAEVKEVRYE